jgi:hypothetical protein
MKQIALFIVGSIGLCGAVRAEVVPLDGEAVIAGVGVACTGIGESKQEPRWQAYPVRVEFANADREYLIGATVKVANAKGAPLLTASCAGPWLLLKFPDRAAYRVEATIDGAAAAARSATVRAPASGQTRVVMTFPELRSDNPE